MLAYRYLYISGLLSYFVLANLLCANKPLPFLPGERLEYDLHWGIFPVGYASLEIAPRTLSSQEPWKISFFVRTNNFADSIYKVRTNITCWVDSNFTKSLKYIKTQQEGRTRKHINVDFDYLQKKISYTEKGYPTRILKLDKDLYDPLAIAYAFRYWPTAEGTSKVFPTSDGKKFLDVEVKVGEAEKIRVPFGSFKANDVIPNMKTLSGVFKKSPKGILRVWYSQDNRRIPVKISSKVIVGSFTAKLKKAERLQKNL